MQIKWKEENRLHKGPCETTYTYVSRTGYTDLVYRNRSQKNPGTGNRCRKKEEGVVVLFVRREMLPAFLFHRAP